MSKLTRNLFIPCLDTSKGAGEAVFVPIDLSTVFEFAFNPVTETYGYICNANDTTETTGYAPTLPQEIVLDNENPMYKFIYPLCMGMPTGSEAKVPALLIEPDMETGKPTRGRLWPDATVTPDTLNTVDGKISFTLNLNGDFTTGTVAKDAGKITFTPDPDESGAEVMSARKR